MPRTDIQSPGSTDVVVVSAARTVSGDTGVLTGWGSAKTLRMQLDVTAAAGTAPSLTVLVEDTLDGSTFNTIGTFTAKIAAGREVINITSPFTEWLRVGWTVAGTTPSFTFSVTAYSE